MPSNPRHRMLRDCLTGVARLLEPVRSHVASLLDLAFYSWLSCSEAKRIQLGIDEIPEDADP